MTARRIQVVTQGGGIRLEVEVGHGTEPIRLAVKLDPASALHLSSLLETAVHQLHQLHQLDNAATQPTKP